jgi:hypothetical protein
MGKLAERYSDAARSGVYRVRDGAVPRAAAGEAGLRAREASAAMLLNGGFESLGTWSVLLIDGAEALPAPQYAKLVEALMSLAHGARSRGEPFFAVMVDPHGALDLPRLYKEPE